MKCAGTVSYTHLDVYKRQVENLSIPMEKKKLDRQIDCPQNLRICYDRKWTAEALFNVMDNAVKYTPEYGKIRIEAEVLGMFVRLSVSDTGIGIAPEHMNDVFQRFFREERYTMKKVSESVCIWQERV